ncbi:hypothetical protein ACFOON_08810 [Novosphingobium piscinae]|uniref:Uncharacterized protein n=1 Tax=Novosphingobium piscinae TaxID=1507448 RepID=A0A7X1KPT6_9SPHN|nr:hypothetical protein [Novosphingobium piscinae]MBC2669059.1 hypothetical protein [Novosphingobium piscinae]
MATIIRDPLVEDNIVELDIVTEADRSDIRRRYEAGQLILLRGFRYDLDFKFLDSLCFDVDGPPEFLRKLKKYGGDKIAQLCPESANPLDQFVFAAVFQADAGRLAYYQDQVASGNAQCDALYTSIFPDYRTTKSLYTWRFTSTKYENLHWDNFGIPETFHQVRIFTNIAKSPRLWMTSHHIGHYAESIYDQYDLGALRGRIGDDLNRHVNTVALGGMKAPCMDRLPRHHLAFEQGDVWLCETRIVCHQIYHGEKAFAAMYFSDPASMERPELGFDALIEELHARHLPAHSANSPVTAPA